MPVPDKVIYVISINFVSNWYIILSYILKLLKIVYFNLYISQILQFKIPDVEMEKLQQAETEETQRQLLERFAQDLPVTNRTIKGGNVSYMVDT